MKTYSRKKIDEQEEVIIDLNELCRLCMNKEEELFPIFENIEPIPLQIRIMACAALEVLEDDGLPNKICHHCKMQLEKYYAFRKKCESTDLKLRQHVKNLMIKLGDIESEDEQPGSSAELVTSDSNNTQETMNTEEDLVGVTQVAFITPDQEPNEEDPEEITLPVEEELNREACTLDSDSKARKNAKNEQEFFIIPDQEDQDEQQEEYDIKEPILEDQELDFIAEAVKSTLATHPSINFSGNLQMKVEQQPGKPTQVSVTTDDGSLIVMELTSEEPEDEDDEQFDQTGVEEDEAMVDEGEIKVFQCPECPKSFSRRIQLRRHSSVHMKQRGFSCGICEKWFPTRSALIRHERIHTGERPFQCEVCQRSFAQKEILFRHLMTHSGVKPYDCPHCSKRFAQKETLKAHLKTHLNVSGTESSQMFHSCTLCPKVFCHASGLSRHLVTHTGKTFKCRDCDKKFNDKSSLRRHLKQCVANGSME